MGNRLIVYKKTPKGEVQRESIDLKATPEGGGLYYFNEKTSQGEEKRVAVTLGDRLSKNALELMVTGSSGPVYVREHEGELYTAELKKLPQEMHPLTSLDVKTLKAIRRANPVPAQVHLAAVHMAPLNEPSRPMENPQAEYYDALFMEHIDEHQSQLDANQAEDDILWLRIAELKNKDSMKPMSPDLIYRLYGGLYAATGREIKKHVEIGSPSLSAPDEAVGAFEKVFRHYSFEPGSSAKDRIPPAIGLLDQTFRNGIQEVAGRELYDELGNALRDEAEKGENAFVPKGPAAHLILADNLEFVVEKFKNSWKRTREIQESLGLSDDFINHFMALRSRLTPFVTSREFRSAASNVGKDIWDIKRSEGPVLSAEAAFGYFPGFDPEEESMEKEDMMRANALDIGGRFVSGSVMYDYRGEQDFTHNSGLVVGIRETLGNMSRVSREGGDLVLAESLDALGKNVAATVKLVKAWL